MNVGVIGAGIISDIYLRNMIEMFSNLDVVAVAAKHLDHAEKCARKFGIRACTVEALLDSPDIEMVVNLTPVGAHYDLIRQALLAGKHVYTEKTLAQDMQQAQQLLALADEKKLYLGSAPDTFLGSALQTARQAIDQGLLGEVNSFAVSVHRNNTFLISHYPFLQAPGAGVLLDFCVYYVTALVSLFGPMAQAGGIISAPYKTHGCILPGPNYGKPLPSPNESQVSAVLQTRSGVTGTFHIDSESNTRGDPFFMIYGTKGMLRLPDPDYFGGEVLFYPNSLTQEQAPVSLPANTPLSGNCRGVGPAEMAQAIAQGRPNRASKEMALHVLEVLTALLKTGQNGGFFPMCTECRQPAPFTAADSAGILRS